MMKNKKRSFCIIGAAALIALLVVGLITFMVYIDFQQKITIYDRMPFIAFYSNTTREDGIYICSNGDMYQGVSEESFLMASEDIANRIKNKEFDGFLKYLGNCGEDKTKQMYVKFYRICVNETYRVERRSYEEPKNATKESNGSQGFETYHRYWFGFYADENGIVNPCEIYISKEGLVCSDTRAYKIVEWMYDCLVQYAGY